MTKHTHVHTNTLTHTKKIRTKDTREEHTHRKKNCPRPVQIFTVPSLSPLWLQVAETGSSQCFSKVSEDGTLVGLYLLIAGFFLVLFTLAYALLSKHCRTEVLRAAFFVFFI